MLSLTLIGCYSKRVSFPYLQPAAIDIPGSVHHMVLVDNSAMKDQTADILEGGLTGEGIGQDGEATLQLIEGIREVLSHSDRYVLSKETKRYGQNKLLENIPQPMNSSLVKLLAKRHNADAVFSIDKFDSDFIITNAKVDKKDDETEAEYKKHAYQARGVATVKAYIRVYDGESADIIDEMKLSDAFEWSAFGSSVDAAVRALMNKQRAVNEVAYKAGLKYGKRIAPSTIYASRKYYSGPNKFYYLASGARRAEVNDWEGAIEDWKKQIDEGDRRAHGKAAYNIAIAYEVLGELEMAISWAQKAYVEYGLSDARGYQRVLRVRVEQLERLKAQMQLENEELPENPEDEVEEK